MAKKIQRDPKDVAIANAIMEQYSPETRDDVQEALKRIFGPIFESMLQGELNAHLGYQSNDHDYIYGFNISAETISDITDSVIAEVEEWQNRPLKKFYTFMFVDCMYVSIKKEYDTKNYAVYTILGYDVNGCKDILGIWLNETESKHNWMQIFDELKTRGVEDVLFISMDGVSGLGEGAKAIFKNVVVQRCVVHLIRNSIKYKARKTHTFFTKEKNNRWLRFFTTDYKNFKNSKRI